MTNLLDGSALLPTPPPDDTTAANLYQKWDTATPEDQSTMRPQLLAYADAQDAAANSAKALKWQQIYSDPNTLGGHISTIKDDPALTHSTTPDETTSGAANMAYLSDTTGMSMDELAQNWPSIRSGYALKNHGKDAKNDKEFFGLIAQEVARKKAISDSIGKLPGDAVVQAFQDVVTGKDTSTLDTFNAWKDQHPDIVKDYPEATLHKLYSDLYSKTAQIIAPLAPQAKAIFDSLAKDTGRPDAPVFAIDPAQLASQIQDLPTAQKQALYTIATVYAERTGQSKGFWTQIGESIGRSVTGTVGSVSLAAKQNEIQGKLDLLKNGQAAIMPDGSIIPLVGAQTQTAQDYTTPTEEQKTDLTAKLQEHLKAITTVRELNALASQQIDPIKPVVDWMPHALESGLYAAAGSLPLVATSLLQPEVGLPVVGAAIFGQEFDRISLAYPNLPTSQVNTMAALSAAPQTAMMNLRAEAILGKLPVLGNYLQKLGNPQMNPIFRAGLNTIGQSAEQGAMNMVQSAVPMMVDGLAKAAGADMPEYDLGKALEAYKDSTPEILFSVLPFALIGAGVATHADYRRGQEMTASARGLREAGFTQAEADRISKIEDPRERTRAIQEGWDSRSQEDIKSGAEMITERIQGDAKMQADPTTPTMRVEDEVVNGQATGNKVFTVLDEQGNQKIQTTDPEAAVHYYRVASQDAASAQRGHLTSLMEFFKGVDKEQGRERTYTIDTKTVTAADEAAAGQSTEQLAERMHQEEIPAGTPLDQVVIKGKTIPDLSRQIYSDTILVLDGRADTMVHERLDGEVMAALHEGRISQEQFLEWCKQTEKATGTPWLPEIPEGGQHSAQQIRETVTKIGEAYLAGRIRKIESIPQGMRGLFKKMLVYFQHVLAKAKVLRAAIDAGKVDANFQTFLAKSVGLPEEAIVENHAASVTRDTVRSVEQEGKLETAYSLSLKNAKKPYDEILSPTGHRDWGVLTHTDEERSGGKIKAGSIRLLKGEHWGPNKGYGIDHIIAEHSSDFEGKSRPMEDQIHNVLLNFNEVYEGKNGRLILLVNKPKTVASVELRPENKGGEHFYSVVTAYPKENPSWKPEGVRILGGRRATFAQSERAPRPTAQEGVNPNLPLEPLLGKYSNEYLQSLREPVKSPSSSLTETGGSTANDPKKGSRAVATEKAPTHQLPDGSQIEGPTSYSISALHGSPYEFDRFNTDKVGSGSGGQAHGWGVYFSQNPHESQIYRTNSTSGEGKIKGKPISDIWTKYILSASGWKLERAIAVAKETSEGKVTPEMGTAFKKIPEGLKGEARKAAAYLEKISQEDITAPKQGYLYTAELLPEHNDFLQWDKPMSEQSPKVKAAIEKLKELPRWKDDQLAKELLDREDAKGASIYQTIAGGYAEHHQLEKASKDLLEAGIPGLTYENGNTGEGGKNNYVLFDPNLARIIERNGEPIQPKEASYSLTTKAEQDRLNESLQQHLNRSPDARLAVYERMKANLDRVMARNNADMLELRDGRDYQATEAEQAAEADRAARIADLHAEEEAEIRNAMDANAAKFMGKIEGATPSEKRRINAQAKDRAAIIEKGIRQKYDEKIKAIENEAKIQPPKADGGEKYARMLQSIGELEAIIKALPVEIRGKIGGYREILSKSSDKARTSVLIKRIEMADKALEKLLKDEYLEKIQTTLQNAKPRKGDSGVKKSTLGAVVQEFADKAYEASLLDNDATVERLESLGKQIAKTDDPKKEADLVEAWAITNTFGALAEQSSLRLKAALDYLKKELAGGRTARRAAEQARIDDIREKQGVISEALPGWTDAGLNKVNSPGWWEETKDLARQMVWSHASYEQILRRILPPEAQGIVEEWSDRIRRANGKTEAAALKNWQNLVQAIQKGAGSKGFMKTADALSELGEKREGKVSKLEGRQVELETIPIDKAEQLVRGEMARGEYTKADIKQMEDALIAMPIESRRKHISIYRVIEEGRTESIPMTLDEMIFTTMAWEQADVRVKMENSGWTQESYDQMVKEIASSKVATALRDYLKDFYRNSTKEINPVYSRMFGMSLPDNPDYAPTSYESRKASGEMSPDGSPTQNTTTPGFAKARVTHNEVFKITPAIQIYQQRAAEQAQWVAFAELHREMSAVLNGKNVRLSMKQENGKRLSELMSQVLDNIAKGGGVNTDAAYMKKWLGAATSGTAVASMGYNLKTIFNQFDSVTRFLYAMPLKDVMRAITNPQKVLESIPAAWNSETVQNRVLEGSNPAARFALKQAGMTPSKFLSAWYGVGAAGLKPMQYADGALTSLSSAMVYSDAHAKALKSGLSEKDAEARALDAMDAAIWRFSQPVMFSAKSPVENNAGATMKLLYMFASDARLKTGIMIDAIQSMKDGKGSKADHFRRIGVVFLGAMLAQTVSNIYRDIFSDDDDDEIWTARGYAKALALAPFQGFFLLGTAIDVALSSMTGQRAYTNSSNPLVTAGSNAIVAAKHSSDVLQTDDMEAFYKELGRIARAISLTPVTAVPAAVLNPVKPIVGAKKNIDKER